MSDTAIAHYSRWNAALDKKQEILGNRKWSTTGPSLLGSEELNNNSNNNKNNDKIYCVYVYIENVVKYNNEDNQ